MKEPRLMMATAAEKAAYEAASRHSGVAARHEDILAILKDPLCLEQKKHQPRRSDDAYLVVASTVPRTVQWHARHSDGFRYPFGSVMTVVNDPLAAREATA